MIFSEKDVADFEILEEDVEEEKARAKNKRLRCWVGTWNNPSMTDEEFESHLDNLEKEEILQYATFQREKGEKTGTIHFQFFVNFKNPYRFTRVKELLPYGCHFKPMYSNALRCKNYCQKAETRVSGPYEIGEWEEERQRTDLVRATQMINDGYSLQEVFETFPTQYVMYGKRFEQIFNQRMQWEFEKKCRNVEVVYIYGPERVGKTTWIESQFDFGDLFVIDNYDNYWFTGYKGERAILLDEFAGQVRPLTRLNKLLEPWPQKMNTKGSYAQACFDKVYFVSNYSPYQIYKSEQDELPKTYKAFIKRLNKIVRFDEDGNQIVERETIWEDIPAEEQKFPGLTRRAKRVVEYDRNGIPTIIYDRERFVQSELRELSKEEEGGLPW